MGVKESAGLDLGLVYTTCSTRDEALNMARALVQKKLVACVNVGSPIASVYVWKAQVCEEAEVPVLLKTRASLFELVRSEIKKLHSYTCPCVLMWSVPNADPDYAAWLKTQTLDPDSF